MKYRRWGAMLLVVCMIVTIFPATVFAEKDTTDLRTVVVLESEEIDTTDGKWMLDSNRWWYELKSGDYLKDCKIVIDGKTYLFNKSGYMVTGWSKEDGKWYYYDVSGVMTTGWANIGNIWYYFDQTGVMVTGLQKIGEQTYYFNAGGGMVTGWKQIDGKYYYFDASGAMQRSKWIGEFYVDENGVWDQSKIKQKWIQNSMGWWYRHEDGSYTRNDFEKIGEQTYYFDTNGYMVTGWKQIDSKWYYYDVSGAMTTGWANIGNIWYYFDQTGVMVTGFQKIGEQTYYFNAGGGMVTDWKQIDGKYYYFDASGAMQRSKWIGESYVDENGVWDQSKVKQKWIQDSVGWWYRHEDGGYTTNGFEVIGGQTYYFNSRGYMVTGLMKMGDDYYFFDTSGAMVKNQCIHNVYFDENGVVVFHEGWNQLGSDWVYLKDGKLVVDFLYVNNYWYYFEQNHFMVTGWYEVRGIWYYFDKYGAMVTGWHYENNYWYYLNADGSMAIGWKKIGNIDYYFDKYGAMVTGWQQIDGCWQYFAPSGAMAYNVNGIIVVNKKHPLPDGYEPGEHPQAGASIRRLIKDMQNAGYNISSSYSGYRSYNTQSGLYWNYVSAYGQAAADTFSARPGYSEHQTGLAFDLLNYSGALVETWAEANWIATNAHKYGFIVRYQYGKDSITGYKAEPWHLRYVGSSATSIYNSGLTLEEYLGVTGGGY